jgi:hypothetical protein
MARLVSCQTYTTLCPLCGRTKPQTTFCAEVAQDAANAEGSYFADSRNLTNNND